MKEHNIVEITQDTLLKEKYYIVKQILLMNQIVWKHYNIHSNMKKIEQW